MNRLSSSAYLLMAFSQALGRNEGVKDNQHSLIAISLSCITVVLSFAIALTISFIKRRDKLKAKEPRGHGMETKSGNTIPDLILKGSQLRKVNLPPEHDTRTKTREAIQVFIISQVAYQPQLTKDTRKQHEDNDSESFRGTNTSDSGRGGSEPDIRRNLFSSCHDHTDTTKSASSLRAKVIFHHIETEST